MYFPYFFNLKNRVYKIMVIEWLKFRVSPQSREKFIKIDDEIWTATLAKCNGFLGKQVWINPQIEDEIVCVIHWETREQWFSVEQKLLDETEKIFADKMGEDQYKLIEEGEYQVRKFLQTPS